MKPTVILTPQQIEFYHREGYLVLDAVTTQEEVAWMREIYDRLFARRAGREEGNQFDLAGTDEEGQEAALPQILQPSKYAPELRNGLYRVNAEAIAKQLLGPTAQFQGEHAIFKPPRTGAETPWHQDEAYWNPALNYNSFSLWIPLQPATLENGCMWFVPRSHKLEVQPHHSINHDPRIHGLEMDDPPGFSSAVPCPISAGGCTLHHNRTIHYAGPNHSDVPRRAYIIGLGLPPTPRTDKREFPWESGKQTARLQRKKAAERKAAAA